ncbi:hypothetical protein [Azospirillum sp. ST 5-10]|uniref:hypothetical protein n=1 Tax=unclassified Azospirillum TaxID=2630922 RepID=UPI003F4A5FF4
MSKGAGAPVHDVPAGGAGAGARADPELLRRIDDLVGRIPRHAIRAVIDEIDAGGRQRSGRARMLREALVEQFNRLRPFKARRLFTSLFEPLLVDDPILYHARDPVPGLVQRVDIGGVWQALSRFAFPKLAMEVQDRLDRMAEHALLDRVLTGPEAMAMRERMRRAAADHLALLPTHRRMAEDFLTVANREALADARRRAPHLAAKAPIDLRLLAFVRAVLEEGEPLLRALDRMRLDLSDTPDAGGRRHAEVDGQAALILGQMRELRGLCPNRDYEDPLVWLPPLMALNVKRRYDVTQRYVREYGGPAVSENHPLHQALFGHFAACCAALAETVRVAFGGVDRRAAPAVSLPRPVREALAESLTRLDRSLAALSAGGLLASRHVGPRVRPRLAEAAQALTGTVLPLLAERVHAAVRARHAPAPDHDDVAWLLACVWSWGTTLDAAGYATPELQAFRARVLDDAGKAFLQAAKVEEDDDLAARMAHILRIERLLGAVGESVAPWIGAMSQGLQRIARFHLEGGAPIGPAERAIVDRVVAAAGQELARTRNWQSADLVALLRLHEARPE